VEGDLGLRAGAPGVLAVDRRWIEAEATAQEISTRQAVLKRSKQPEWIPNEPDEARLDGLLAIGCATHALSRHCGTMLLTRGQGGPPTLTRDGPDLREIGLLLGTGGVFVHREDSEKILRAALERRPPRSLSPRDPRLAIDSNYILAAAGLLATEDPAAALRLLRRELSLSKN
jgi:uncharacterized protein (TIGR01319 family)